MTEVIRANRGGMTVERRPITVAPGLVGMHETLDAPVETQRVLVTGTWWIFSLVFPSGHIRMGDTEWRTPFAMLVPPRSLLRMRLQGRVVSPGMAGTAALPGALARMPRVAAVAPGTALPEFVDALARIVDGGTAVDPDAGAPAACGRARALLLDHRDERAPVRHAARALRITPDGLGRMFRRAYGLPPKDYIHRARVADAVLQLMSGSDVLRAAGEAGFPEMSRFYEQFSRITRNRPGDYARATRKAGGHAR